MSRQALYRWMAATINRLDRDGRWLRYHYRDRQLLERVILPALARESAPRQLLMIGCDWYTRHYPRHFDGCSVVTLDVDPARAPFGARRHITDTMANIHHHFAPASLDVIICNGVIGWGLDQREEIEQAFDGCVHALRDDGLLLVGWNDVPPRNRHAPDTLAALTSMVAINIPGLDTHRRMALPRNGHTFQAWRKPMAHADTRDTDAEMTAAMIAGERSDS